MPYARLERDVNSAEEATLRQLEGGGNEAVRNGLPWSYVSATDAHKQQSVGVQATSTGENVVLQASGTWFRLARSYPKKGIFENGEYRTVLGRHGRLHDFENGEYRTVLGQTRDRLKTEYKGQKHEE